MKIIGTASGKNMHGHNSLLMTGENCDYFKTGSLEYRDPKSKITFEKCPVFTLTLTPNGFSRGRSSVTQDFLCEGNNEYHMSAKATSEMFTHIANGNIHVHDGRIMGQFVVIKQGTAYSLFPYYGEVSC